MRKKVASSTKHALCLLLMEKLVYVFSVSSLVTIKCQSNVASLKKNPLLFFLDVYFSSSALTLERAQSYYGQDASNELSRG